MFMTSGKSTVVELYRYVVLPVPLDHRVTPVLETAHYETAFWLLFHPVAHILQQ